jgi:hypothetical protein
MTPTAAERQLLAVLVMDLGYDHFPLYGHTPMRHQWAWHLATLHMEPNEIYEEVAQMRAQQMKESR